MTSCWEITIQQAITLIVLGIEVFDRRITNVLYKQRNDRAIGRANSRLNFPFSAEAFFNGNSWPTAALYSSSALVGQRFTAA